MSDSTELLILRETKQQRMTEHLFVHFSILEERNIQ